PLTGPLTGVVAPPLASLVEDAGLVDRLEVFDRHGADSGPLGLLRAGRRLRGAEQAWVFGPSLRAAALSLASGAKQRIGMGGAGRELFLNDLRRSAHPPRSVHLCDQFRALVLPQATDAAQCEWVPGPIGAAGLANLRAAEPRLEQAFVALGASAMFGPAKQWPSESFVELARRFRDEDDLLPVFIGGPGDAERRMAAELADAAGGVDLAGRTDLPTLAALLDAARLYVGNDSGPMHLAAATGTPTVGIFGSTNPAWTAPRGPRAVVVGPGPVDCSPCYRRQCPYDLECLRTTSVEHVHTAACELLGAS
ncbi:hypothetical protein DRQ53_11415, partial [bacterium]